MIPKLRISEVLKESYRIFKLHIGKILILCLLIVLPLSLVSAYFSNVLANDSVISSFQDTFLEMSQVSDSDELAKYQSDIVQYYQTIIPYIVIVFFITLIGMVFEIALLLITRDEGRHGLLTERRFDGDIIVDYENDKEIHDVGSAFDYFALAVKILPKYALTFFIGLAISALGLFTLILPGIIFLVVTILSLHIVTIDNSFGVKPLIKTGAVILRNPSLLFYFVLPELVSYVFSSCVITLLAKLGLEGIPMVIAEGVTNTIITFVLSIFTIALSVAFIDADDRIMKMAKEMRRDQ